MEAVHQFKLQPDGKTLIVTRVMKSPKLPRAVEFSLTYVRQRGTPTRPVYRLTKPTERPRTNATASHDHRSPKKVESWVISYCRYYFLLALLRLAQRANVLMGGFIHVLLVLAVVTVLIRITTDAELLSKCASLARWTAFAAGATSEPGYLQLRRSSCSLESSAW